MPQHAVAKGYWKSEYLRAQLRSSLNFVVAKPDSAGFDADGAPGIAGTVSVFTTRTPLQAAQRVGGAGSPGP